MEFESRSTNGSPDISDAQRALASSRRIVVTPLTPDPSTPTQAEPDVAEQADEEYVIESPLVTITTDTESTAGTNAKLPDNPKSHLVGIVLGCSVTLIVSALAIVYVLMR